MVQAGLDPGREPAFLRVCRFNPAVLAGELGFGDPKTLFVLAMYNQIVFILILGSFLGFVGLFFDKRPQQAQTETNGS